MHLKHGAVLQGGKYKIEKLLGQGGFGITYLAVQTGLDRKVAIKEFFMKEHCNRDADTSHVSVPSVGSRELVAKFKEKFIKEAQMISGYKHPNIVIIHDVFEENGTAYYVMEYHGGGSLSSLSLPLSYEEASGYIRQVASALSYLHDHNTMHLDVKPSNVLIDSDGNAVLIDFGVSKRYDQAGHQTSSTPVGISHGYAPGEQYQQGTLAFSPATDIYALGATFYKLVTGDTPPDQNEVNENGLPPFPATVPASIAALIEKSMQPRRKDRPQSISGFLGMLDEALVASTGDETKVDSEDDASTVIFGNDKVDVDSGNKTPTPSEKKKSRRWLWWLLIFLFTAGFSLLLFRNDSSSPTDGVFEPSCWDRGHGYVDLGLSVCWATHNMGASDIWDCGYLYAWGETIVKDTYTSGNSRTYGHDYGREKNLEGVDNPVWTYDGMQEYDAATANWKGNWRMPTHKEFQELIENCNWTWITLNGRGGYKVTSRKNGNSIFLPAAEVVGQASEGTRVGYWSASDVGGTDIEFARFLCISPDTYSLEWENRFVGLNVRPVLAANAAAIEMDYDEEVFHYNLDEYYRLMHEGLKYEEESRLEDAYKNYNSAMEIENKWKSSEDYFLFDLKATKAVMRVADQVCRGAHNDHGWVDLGLSVKWATCNLGASRPEEAGDYYAWGEINTKAIYTEDNSESYRSKDQKWNNIGGTSEYDAARANWGGSWRMPTLAEFKELIDNCDWTWTTLNKGYKVTSKKNGQSIFLPAAGHRDGGTLCYGGDYGYYWSSTSLGSYGKDAFYGWFRKDTKNVSAICRYYGKSVRPVLEN